MNEEYKEIMCLLKQKEYKDKNDWERFLENNRRTNARRLKRQKANEILFDDETIDYARFPKIKKNTTNKGDI